MTDSVLTCVAWLRRYCAVALVVSMVVWGQEALAERHKLTTRDYDQIAERDLATLAARPGAVDESDEPDKPDAFDVLDQARKDNLPAEGRWRRSRTSRQMAAHVERLPQRFPIDRRKAGSYRLQIAAGEPMLSPAAAEGKVFFGGGFHSPYVHCIDARSGKTRWSVRLSDPGPTSPAYQDGVIYYNTESCTTYALSADTGRKLWARYLGSPLIAMPAVTEQCVLACYPATRPAAGNEPSVLGGQGDGFWPNEMTPEVAAQMAEARLAAMPREGCRIVALDLKTGMPRWEKWIDHHVISAPVVYGEDVCLTTFAGTFYKLRLGDGEILIARKCRATSAPVVVDDAVFFTRRVDDDADGPKEAIMKIDRVTGRPVYAAQVCRADYLSRPDQQGANKRSPALGYVASWADAPVQTVGRRDVAALQQYSGSRLLASDGRLCGCLGNTLLCAEPEYGQQQWAVPLGSAGHDRREVLAGPPALAGEKLFVATIAGRLLVVDPSSGNLDRTIKLRAPVSTEPIIDDGRVFLGTRDGRLLCVNLGDRKITGWGQWGGSPGRNGPPQNGPPPRQLAQASGPAQSP